MAFPRPFQSVAAAVLGVVLAASAAEAKVYKVGVTQGPHEQVVEFVKTELARQGVEIEVIGFSDYVLPNQALNDGDLDINSFQHQPYLDNQVKDRGYGLVSVGKSIVLPMGIYSRKIKSFADFKAGDTIGLPNDPTNGGRALLLMQSAGLIKVDPKAGLRAGPADVVDNPKGLKFVELDAAQLPRAIPDLVAAAVNTNYAIQAGLVPTRDALVVEDADSPYANVIAVKAANRDAAWVKAFVAAYHSEATRKFIVDTFKGSIVPAF
ncbi:DL-methionine transporter subunit; periplasmic-binding component of ABC superfamily [uncultured Alphaproteobacteria bacterium]|uniref:DL-methionine transporter subunit periplasmic-binding component of ABC superfamily n=1 Tax=uncultured Alphaproteobacteria bacterium TaxID=91750 RepID=A0A212KM79_9PROT|nr:DL-methionine transporter subunit; periplasmic-binding component of ABC superfamily [uncultured Alphaproteobacteria bacterium]